MQLRAGYLLLGTSWALLLAVSAWGVWTERRWGMWLGAALSVLALLQLGSLRIQPMPLLGWLQVSAAGVFLTALAAGRIMPRRVCPAR